MSDKSTTITVSCGEFEAGQELVILTTDTRWYMKLLSLITRKPYVRKEIVKTSSKSNETTLNIDRYPYDLVV